MKTSFPPIKAKHTILESKFTNYKQEVITEDCYKVITKQAWHYSNRITFQEQKNETDDYFMNSLVKLQWILVVQSKTVDHVAFMLIFTVLAVISIAHI